MLLTGIAGGGGEAGLRVDRTGPVDVPAIPMPWGQ